MELLPSRLRRATSLKEGGYKAPSSRGLSPKATGGVLKIREHQPGGKDHCKAGDAHGKVDIILLFAAQHLQAGAAVTAPVAAV